MRITDESSNKLVEQFWFILEGGKYSTMAQITNGCIKPELITSSWFDACPYTNTLAILSKAASKLEYKGITLLINEKSSVMQALNNFDNHDERFILLR